LPAGLTPQGKMRRRWTRKAAHAVIIGFGRVGRLVADMLKTHDKPYVGVDSDPDLVAGALRQGYHATFGEASSNHMIERLGLERANCVILTMDEPRTAQRLVKKLRAQYPDLPILARARDTIHAATMYRAGVTMRSPKRWRQPCNCPKRCWSIGRADGLCHRLDPRKT
jgi:CPA2 family monovalent cation:H+ antiporter-2